MLSHAQTQRLQPVGYLWVSHGLAGAILLGRSLVYKLLAGLGGPSDGGRLGALDSNVGVPRKLERVVGT